MILAALCTAFFAPKDVRSILMPPNRRDGVAFAILGPSATAFSSVRRTLRWDIAFQCVRGSSESFSGGESVFRLSRLCFLWLSPYSFDLEFSPGSVLQPRATSCSHPCMPWMGLVQRAGHVFARLNRAGHDTVGQP